MAPPVRVNGIKQGASARVCLSSGATPNSGKPALRTSANIEGKKKTGKPMKAIDCGMFFDSNFVAYLMD
jgi:hypothetical protein